MISNGDGVVEGTFNVGDFTSELAEAATNFEVGTGVWFENERIRVWEILLEPGQRGPFHSHTTNYADAWALRGALVETDHDIDTALGLWEPRQLELGRTALARTRDMGYRSQVAGTMLPGDPEWKFGLWEPGN